MIIRKISKKTMMNTGANAQRRLRDGLNGVLENIADFLRRVNECCEESGYRITLERGDFDNEFIGFLESQLRYQEVMMILVITNNIPVEHLNRLQPLRDSAAASIVSVDQTLRDSVVIEALRVRKKYDNLSSIDYALNLLHYEDDDDDYYTIL